VESQGNLMLESDFFKQVLSFKQSNIASEYAKYSYDQNHKLRTESSSLFFFRFPVMHWVYSDIQHVVRERNKFFPNCERNFPSQRKKN
jgi:hypothetical protein